jgi:hypothetical protein
MSVYNHPSNYRTEPTFKGTVPDTSMASFFARDDVRELQAVQKRNPYGSPAHRRAFETMRSLARDVSAEFDAAEFFGEY